MTEHIRKLQATVLRDCQHYVKTKETLAIQANNLFWEHFPKERREYHPFNLLNLQAVISRIPNYVRCIQQCVENWLGYHFHFPLLWLPAQQYKADFRLPKKEELAAWQKFQNAQGFRDMVDNTTYTYCISNLHCKSQYSDSELE